MRGGGGKTALSPYPHTLNGFSCSTFFALFPLNSQIKHRANGERGTSANRFFAVPPAVKINLACSRRSDSGEGCEVKKAMKSRGGLGRASLTSPPSSFLFFALLFTSHCSPLCERLEQAKINQVLPDVFIFLNLSFKQSEISLRMIHGKCSRSPFTVAGQNIHRGTQREYSSKPLKHSIVERILVFRRQIQAYFYHLKLFYLFGFPS